MEIDAARAAAREAERQQQLEKMREDAERSYRVELAEKARARERKRREQEAFAAFVASRVVAHLRDEQEED